MDSTKSSAKSVVIKLNEIIALFCAANYEAMCDTKKI